MTTTNRCDCLSRLAHRSSLGGTGSTLSHFTDDTDGNGNVSALVKADDSELTAQYEYGPFGELLRATGPMAKANPFRFSTKYQDNETDLLYYGYRYYNASTGRWPNRDLIAERGGGNLYGFVLNRATDLVDLFGLADCKKSSPNTNPRPEQNMSAYGLGWEWVKGGSDHVFYEGDKLTEQPKGTPGVGDARKKMITALSQTCCGSPVPSVPVNRSLRYNGYWANAYFVVDFADDMVRNPTRAYLGSFDGNANVACTDCCVGRAVVKFHVWNYSGGESAGHLPCYGYQPRSDGSSRPSLGDIFTTPLPPDWKWSDVIPGSLFKNTDKGRFRTIRLDFYWEEELNFKPKNCGTAK